MEWRLKYDYKQLESLGLQVSDINTVIQRYLNKEFLGIGTVVTGSGNELWIRVALASGNGNDQKQSRKY